MHAESFLVRYEETAWSISGQHTGRAGIPLQRARRTCELAGFGSRAAYAKQFIRDKLLDHKEYICKHGEDMPEIRNWKWKGAAK